MSFAKSKDIHEFLFAQQGQDSTCHLLPLINLEIIAKLKPYLAINRDVAAMAASWKSQAEWNAITYTGLLAWYKCMAKLTTFNKRDNAFGAYYQNLLEQVINMGDTPKKSYDGKAPIRSLCSYNCLFAATVRPAKGAI